MPIDDFDKFRKSLPSKGFTNNTKNILDDCDRPACDDTVSALQAALNHAKGNASFSSATSSSLSSSSIRCPPTKSALGHGSWDLLHSMAAWYPENPTPKEERMIRQFFDGFARFYPCTWCSEDFQQNIKQKPVESSSRKSLCVWLCEQHNIVNEKLGKPLFQCDMKILDERWRKSSNPKCQS